MLIKINTPATWETHSSGNRTYGCGSASLIGISSYDALHTPRQGTVYTIGTTFATVALSSIFRQYWADALKKSLFGGGSVRPILTFIEVAALRFVNHILRGRTGGGAAPLYSCASLAAAPCANRLGVADFFGLAGFAPTVTSPDHNKPRP
jgi:hypothetical protein